MELTEIVEVVEQLEARHVVLTGGEPMVVAELPRLCEALHRLDRHITIETAGTAFHELHCDLMSISPKLRNSTPTEERAGRWRRLHEQRRHQPAVIERLITRYPFQIKFVVDQPADLEEIDEYLTQFPSIRNSDVWLMPQGVVVDELAERGDWLGRACRRTAFIFVHACTSNGMAMFEALD